MPKGEVWIEREWGERIGGVNMPKVDEIILSKNYLGTSAIHTVNPHSL